MRKSFKCNTRQTNYWKARAQTQAHTSRCYQGSQLNLLREIGRFQFFFFFFIPKSVVYRLYTKLKRMADYLWHNKFSP